MPYLELYGAASTSPPGTPLRYMSRCTQPELVWRYEYRHDAENNRVVINSWTPIHYGALPIHLLPAELAGLPIWHYRWPTAEGGRWPNLAGCFMEPVPY